MYPWEATVNGTEQTPRYSKASDGSIIEVMTQDYEHHISADVSYGIYNYYRVTGDKEFMEDHGAEIIFETARFWASRAVLSKKDKKYHINDVIGPDEFHVKVNDNAYTNYLAKWNLRYAGELYNEFKGNENIRKLKKSIKLTDREVESWIGISENIIILRSSRKKIINQFEGYLKKKDYMVKEYDNKFLPLSPITSEFGGFDKTNLIKQADVLALFSLFPEDFSLEDKLANYKYYLLRTIHSSSLSYCMHAGIANDLGDYFRSFCFFWLAINVDLQDIPCNTSDGIHAANLGGVWQALIAGYGGIKCNKDEIRIIPRLPGNFRKLNFRFYHRKDLFEIEETRDYVKLRFVSDKSAVTREVWVLGKKISLAANKYKTVKLEEFWINVITAEDVMKKKNLVTLNETITVREVAKILQKKDIAAVTIVDDKNNIKGIISEKNMLQSTYRNRFGSLMACDIMESNVVSVNCKDSI